MVSVFWLKNIQAYSGIIDQIFKGKENAKKKRENYKKQFVKLDLTKIADNKLKGNTIYNARKNNPKATGLKIGDEYFSFGSGSGVNGKTVQF